MAAAVTVAAWSGQDPHRHWLGVNGADWRRMGPDVRLAYVEGFLAGAALGQAAAGASDSAAARMRAGAAAPGQATSLSFWRQCLFGPDQRLLLVGKPCPPAHVVRFHGGELDARPADIRYTAVV